MSSVATRVGLVSLLVLGLGATEIASQTVQLKQVMHQKLAESEKLLGALVTSDWAELARRGRALEELTNAPAWQALKTPEYVRQSAVFVQATRDLVDAAERRDQEAAPLAYLSLTVSCVRCHQYVARMRIADAIPAGGRSGRYSLRAAHEAARTMPAPRTPLLATGVMTGRHADQVLMRSSAPGLPEPYVTGARE